MRDYSLDRFRYQPMLDFLNNPGAKPDEMRRKLQYWATLALKKPLSDNFVRSFRNDVQSVFDSCRKIQVRMPATVFIRREKGEIAKGRVLRPRSMELRFDPEYAAHFYNFALLISNPEGLARFSQCNGCQNFFVQAGRLRTNQCFCSDPCRIRFHAAKPGRKESNAAAVRLHRSKARLAAFVDNNAAVFRSGTTWKQKMELYNDEGIGRSRARRFSDPQAFRRACQQIMRVK